MPACPHGVTQREKEVLNLIAEGYTNHQVEVKNTTALINSPMKHNMLNL